MKVIYLIIITPLILICLLFALDYYVFFWGNYLFNLIASIVLIGVEINGIKQAINFIYERKKHKSQLYNKNKIKKQKVKIQLKSAKFIIFEIICSILIIIFTIWFVTKDFLIMSLDLPNVIKGNFIKISCNVEESVKSSSKGDHHSQYLTVRDLKNNNLIEIDFRYKYDRIIENKEYNIWYLPNSHLGYKAEIIN